MRTPRAQGQWIVPVIPSSPSPAPSSFLHFSPTADARLASPLPFPAPIALPTQRHPLDRSLFPLPQALPLRVASVAGELSSASPNPLVCRRTLGPQAISFVRPPHNK